jgi:hypothetical protein
VFYVVPPPETREEVAEDFESFAKYHEELIGQDRKGGETVPPKEEEEEEREEKREEKKKEVTPLETEEEEEKFLFSDQTPQEKVESFSLPEIEKEKEPEVREVRPKKAGIEERRIRGERRSSFRLFALIIVIVVLVLGLFYLWTEMKAGGKLASYVEDPMKKGAQLWERLWGTEKEGLLFKNLAGYEEKVEEASLFIIEGKVDNQSKSPKKYVRLKVAIFDQNRMKVAEKETLCGPTIGRGELKNLPPDFFSGEMILQPKTDKEMMVASGKEIPFMIIFKDLPAQEKEFKVEIVEAPSL